MSALSLFSAGSNARGQLATGNLDDAYHFAPCIFSAVAPGDLPPGTVAVEDISCGANHTLALLLRNDGKTELWGCGDGSRGQLGPSYVAVVAEASGEMADATAIFRPLDLNLHAFKSREGGSLHEYTVRLIAAGWETSYTVLSCPGRDDVLLSMGADDFGNLGVGGAPSQTSQGDVRPSINIVPLRGPIQAEDAGTTLTVLALSTGPHHTIARLLLASADGSTETHIVGWGTTRHGQLGPMSNTASRPLPFTPHPVLVPICPPGHVTQLALGNQHTVCRLSSATALALGSNRKEQLSGLDDLCDVERVGCTWNGTYALLGSGEVVATGSNTHSQLGRGTGGQGREETIGPIHFPFGLDAGRVVQMACGSEHVLCVVERIQHDEAAPRREVWGWGWNEHGNLGTGGTEDVDTPVKIWPRYGDEQGWVANVWAGCGTSWVLVQR
ncbi:RCC1 repeat-containing protein C10F6.04 [Trametes pubescens]|uniref:RCC1 repeat-containing protein C10F6.04 n=1 Tax=Trametes pubescens TaxID=154538 RepID=A0A1M2VKD2_TRAPU|nr:RCC1 repeat-containing protein C10F6.04 [Trametes pubescens]